jgi:hypothetical protein
VTNSDSVNLGKRTPIDMIPRMLEELKLNPDLELMYTPVKTIKKLRGVENCRGI